MLNQMSDRDWDTLLRRIDQEKCTPFLGAGACYGVLPLGGDIAREWAQKYEYPLLDDTDLIRVAQHVALLYDPAYPKEEILDLIKKAAPPDFTECDEPHTVVARLPLPVYMTTNYDDFMVRALADRRRDPKRELCRWHDGLKRIRSVFEEHPGYRPTPANPLVFHLHGHTYPASVVLTEDDYLEFLGEMIRNFDGLLPPPIREALAERPLLFIGYRLADWNFRVLFQALRSVTLSKSYAVLLPPDGSEERRQKAMEFLGRYYGAMDLSIYWGTARDFCRELRDRWMAQYNSMPF